MDEQKKDIATGIAAMIANALLDDDMGGVNAALASAGISPSIAWNAATEKLPQALEVVFKAAVDESEETLTISKGCKMGDVARRYYALDAVISLKSYLALSEQEEKVHDIFAAIVQMAQRIVFSIAIVNERLNHILQYSDFNLTASFGTHQNCKYCHQLLIYPSGFMEADANGKYTITNRDDDPELINAVGLATALAQSIYIAVMQGIATAIDYKMLHSTPSKFANPAEAA